MNILKLDSPASIRRKMTYQKALLSFHILHCVKKYLSLAKALIPILAVTGLGIASSVIFSINPHKRVAI